jgi:hypothetical protein
MKDEPEEPVLRVERIEQHEPVLPKNPPVRPRSVIGERLGSMTRRIGTIQHFRWLKGIIAAIIALNLLDAGLTIFVVSTGQAEEANPLMRDLVHERPVLFVMVKMFLVVGGTYLLWRYRKRPFAVFSIFLAFIVYYALLLFHLRSLDLRLFERLLS